MRPGQGAHVGAAVAPNLRLVPHAAQGEAHELAAQGPGDGAAQGGLAGARRAHEAEDGALHVGLQFPHRQVFQDAFLDLFQVVVVFVQDLPGLGQVQVVFGGLVPGQLDHPFQVIADHLVVRRGGRGPLEAGQFPLRLFQGVGRQIRLFQPKLQFLDLPALFFAFAQFPLQGLDVLPEVILLLGLVHLGLHLGLDLFAQLQDLHFPVDQAQDLAQALFDVEGLQQFLLFGLGDIQAAGGDVGQDPGIAQLPDQGAQFGGQIGGEFQSSSKTGP